MKTAFQFLPNFCLIATVAISGTLATHAAPTNSPAATPTGENYVIPKSTYTIPVTFAEGRDPFFPHRRSGLQPTNPVPTTNTAPTVVLTLNGMSPTFVIINGKTLRVGEETDVPTPTGRVQVRCIEIRTRENSAIVEVDGERQEIRMRSGA